MFEGFETVEVDAGGTTIFVRRKGDMAGGHFFPEQNPGETISELRAFFE